MNQDARALMAARRTAAIQRIREATDEVEAIDAELRSDDDTKRMEAERVASGEYVPQTTSHLGDEGYEPALAEPVFSGGPSVIRKEEAGLPPVGGIDTRVSDEGALIASKQGREYVHIAEDDDEGAAVDSYGTPLEGEASNDGGGDLPLDEIIHTDEEPEMEQDEELKALLDSEGDEKEVDPSNFEGEPGGTDTEASTFDGGDDEGPVTFADHPSDKK